jgi:(p)ppGpp synthase/HD superfamily hydrolase
MYRRPRTSRSLRQIARIFSSQKKMSGQSTEPIQTLLQAISFAARAHEGQKRKDDRTPYASHVFRVCLVLRHVFGIDDTLVMLAAVLHDTIEDTTTDFDDLEERFGANVAQWVAALSKDKRLPEPEREDAYVDALKRAPWQVKLCKLADIYDNLSDARESGTAGRARVCQNARRYLNGLKSNLPDLAQEPFEMVSRLLSEIEGVK